MQLKNSLDEKKIPNSFCKIKHLVSFEYFDSCTKTWWGKNPNKSSTITYLPLF